MCFDRIKASRSLRGSLIWWKTGDFTDRNPSYEKSTPQAFPPMDNSAGRAGSAALPEKNQAAPAGFSKV
jgi:hypothetical protein